MIILVVGLSLLVAGILSINFVSLSQALKEHDQDQWKILGSPKGTSVTDLGKTIGLFSWVLAQGFSHSTSQAVRDQGALDLRKAKISKYLFVAGFVLVFVGFFASVLTA